MGAQRLDKTWPTARSRHAASAKRFTDVTLALIALFLAAPLLITLAAAVRLTSKGPILFVQKRQGCQGILFDIYKFRTVRHEAADYAGAHGLVQHCTALTPIGTFLRHTSFDELPQIFNVLRGDMSLVGPRPHVPDMMIGAQRYDKLVPDYHDRHLVRPGLTGWAQCQGFRGTVVSEGSARARIEHDLYYINHRTWGFDLQIMWLTLLKEFGRVSPARRPSFSTLHDNRLDRDRPKT